MADVGEDFDRFVEYIKKEGYDEKVDFVFVQLDDGTQLSFPIGDPASVYFKLGMAMREVENKVRLFELDVTGSA